MRMKIALTVLLTANFAFSQQLYDLPTDYVRNQVFNISTLTGKGQIYEGSPYLYDEFKPGRLITSQKSFPAMLRYNAYSDVFEIQSGEDQHNEVLKSESIQVKLGNVEYDLKRLPSGETSYLQNMADGDKLQLWMRNKVEFYEPVKAKTTYSRDKPARFVLSESFYIVKGTGLQEIKLRKKDIQALFSDAEGKMKTYVKEQQLSYSKVGDVVKMIQHYNTL